ncbi:kelch domain-containing protein 3-like isoform X2 [Dermacentor variabilis]
MWTARVEGGPCCNNHAAVAISDEVYSFGGYCAEEMNTMRRPMDVHVLNTGSLRWTLIPVQSNLENVPFQRYGHTVVAYGEHAYLWGGRNEDGACSILYRFDTASLTWLRPRTTGETPGAREGHSSCVLGSRMYVFGGREDEADRISQDVHVLDLDTMHWRFLATRGNAPEWRSFHSAVAIGRRMYVWGGRRGSADTQEEVAYCDRLAYLDTTNGAWVHPVTKGTMPLGRCGHAAFVYKGEMYVFGGYNGLLGTFFEDMYKYSPECSQWTQVKLLRKGPCARRGHRCCLIGNRLFLFGGTSPVSSKGSILDRFRESSETVSLVDHPDLHVLDFAPSLKTLCLLVLIDSRMDISHLPDENKWEISCMTSKNAASSPRVCQ